MELTSEHFTVWTDAAPARVRDLLREMEHVRQATIDVLYPTAATSGRSLAIVVRNDRELIEVNNNREPRPFTVSLSPLGQPMIIMSLTASGRTVVHELTHLVSFAAIHNQPRWLAEGMASFVETMMRDSSGTTVVLGAGWGRYERRLGWVPIRELFRWRGMESAAAEQQLYHSAWALFAFLFNEHTKELAHYLWLVDQISPSAGRTLASEQLRAWNEGFPSLPLEVVDDKLQDWVVHGKHLELPFKVKHQNWPVTTRWLSDADTHAIRALILGGPSDAQKAQGRVELSAALAADPLNVLAWMLKQSDREPPSVDTARAITAAHPDDWRAWYVACESLPDGAEAERACSTACALVAQNRALTMDPRLCRGRGITQASP